MIWGLISQQIIDLDDWKDPSYGQRASGELKVWVEDESHFGLIAFQASNRQKCTSAAQLSTQVLGDITCYYFLLWRPLTRLFWPSLSSQPRKPQPLTHPQSFPVAPAHRMCKRHFRPQRHALRGLSAPAPPGSLLGPTSAGSGRLMSGSPLRGFQQDTFLHGETVLFPLKPPSLHFPLRKSAAPPRGLCRSPGTEAATPMKMSQR